MTDTQKHQYAVDTFYYSPAEDIKNINSTSSLSDYISANPTFLDIRNPDIDTIMNGLELLNIKFETVDFTSANGDLFAEVYGRDMYILSLDNVLAMLRNVYQIEGEDIALIQENFTLIFAKPEEPLSKYVERDIETHLASVLELCKWPSPLY